MADPARARRLAKRIFTIVASAIEFEIKDPGLDGVTIVEGHEYAETLTDPYPSTGWIDSSGQENGDKCAWVKLGQGASQNITLSTGSFAVQSTWSNAYNGGSGGCEINHAVTN